MYEYLVIRMVSSMALDGMRVDSWTCESEVPLVQGMYLDLSALRLLGQEGWLYCGDLSGAYERIFARRVNPEG